MKGTRNIAIIAIAAIVLIFVAWGCSAQRSLVKQDENVGKAWANVNTEYQNRYNLVDNLVATVREAANFEQETLTNVVKARASATAINLTADDLTPENIAKMQAAQSQLSGALSRLLVVSESYPQLQANKNFLQFQSQLETIENGVRTSVRSYNDAVASYNVKVRSFPMNLLAGMLGFEKKATFTAEPGAEKAPSVRDAFNKK